MQLTIRRELPMAGISRTWEKSKPDLMEPYSIRLAEARDADERAGIMRAALRETIEHRSLSRRRVAT